MRVQVQLGQCDICCQSNVPIILLEEYATPTDHRVWGCRPCLRDAADEILAAQVVEYCDAKAR